MRIRRLPHIAFRLLLCAIALSPARALGAAGGWTDERVAGPFICRADFSLEPYGELLAEITQLQHDLSRTLGIAQPRETIHVFLFERKTTYESYLNHYFPKVPYRRALFIKARGPGMVFAHRNSEFEVDVRHECTHALLHAALPMMPLWLDEGLAEYFERAPQERAFGNPHLTATRWNLRLGQFPKIEDLESLEDLNQMGRSQYRHAWAWTHFMLHGPPEAHYELVRFLADIEAHTPPGRLSDRLRRRLPDLERRFTEHFKGWRR